VLLASPTIPELEDHPLSSVRSYRPYVVATSSIRYPRTRHALVTATHVNMECY